MNTSPLLTAIRVFLFILIIVGGGLIFARDFWVSAVVDSILAYTGEVRMVSYVCNGGRTIEANYFPGVNVMIKSGQPPIPTGVVSLELSDGRAVDLGQTISASGVRYANPDESFVFWSKGDGALVLERGEVKSYQDCLQKNRL